VQELDLYLQAKIDEYITNGNDDEALWYGYQEDFQNWMEEHFRLQPEHLHPSCELPSVKHGVRVAANNRRGNLASSLFEAAQSKDMSEWTDDEVLTMYNTGKLKDVKSDLLRHKIEIINGGSTILTTKPTCLEYSDTSYLCESYGNRPGPKTPALSQNTTQMGQSQQLEDPTDVPPSQSFPNLHATNFDQPRTTFPTSHRFTHPQAQIGQNDQIHPLHHKHGHSMV
jgi:hypothetical protein